MVLNTNAAFPSHIIILHLDLAIKDYKSHSLPVFLCFPILEGSAGDTILNGEVREDITIKRKALQATLGKSIPGREKSKYQSPEVAANVLQEKPGGHCCQNKVRTQEQSYR